jgi:hypothetical protein
MVNYETKTIFTDAIQSFTANGSINVLSPLNLSNVGIQSNGIDSGSSGGTTLTNLYSTLWNGATGIGISTTEIVFTVASTTSLTLRSTEGIFGGTVYAQSYVTLSDERAKSGIEEVQEGILPRIQSLRAYEYELNKRRTAGLLAQEVKEVFPLAIQSGPDGKEYVNYDAVLAYVVGAIGEIQKKLEHINLKN